MSLNHGNIFTLYKRAQQRLGRLINAGQEHLLKGGKIGLEKETLRVSPDGSIAKTKHPITLGSPLTNPYITTDYSEALIEFITPPLTSMADALDFLRDTQTFVYGKLEDEILWATSMPCVLAGESSIPIAQYGSSNAGRMKHIYRVGLGHRYGRVMQVIAGAHFNYSCNAALWPVLRELEEDNRPPKEFTADAYFAMIRNLQRFGWLIPYLFGAAPAVCKSFVGDQPTDMQDFDATTYFYPFATSLRMGDIGYQNNKAYETGFKASYDDLNAYIRSLTWAIETPCPRYQEIGVVVDGKYRQLNANILQVENEYYSTVRPKQVPANNEKPTLVLRNRGIKYIELRSLDVNAYDPLGINEQQLRFLEAFMVFCLFHESPPIGERETREIDENESDTAHKGRDPSLRLKRNGQTLPLKQWAAEICNEMQGFCEIMDEGEQDPLYTHALKAQREAIEDPERTPSARMLAEMRENKEGFYQLAKRLSQKHYQYFKNMPLSQDRLDFFRETAEQSLRKQREMEASDTMSFEEYLQRYFAQS